MRKATDVHCGKSYINNYAQRPCILKVDRVADHEARARYTEERNIFIYPP